MADFDDNPFADPDGINPFADPAVTEATTSKPDTVVEDYNPFAEEAKKPEPEPPRLPPPPTKAQVKASKPKEKEKPKSKKPAAPSRPVDTEPAIMQADQDPPPTYTPAPNSFADPKDDELRKREEEISRRESALKEREKNLERLGRGDRPNNFPPFPKFCPAPFKPCFYLNIKVEVPPSEHWKMYALVALLIYIWIVYILNLVVAIIGAIGAPSDKRGEYLTTMGVSILYLVLFVPGSLFCWFLPAYYAYRSDSSLSFMWFFFVMMFQILGFLLNAIGIPNMGACGFFNGSAFFNASGENTSPSQQSVATGAMFLIIGFLWLLGLPLAVILLITVHRYYRRSGGSLNKAMEEGVSGAAKNQYVRGAVKSGVSAGVKTAFDK